MKTFGAWNVVVSELDKFTSHNSKDNFYITGSDYVDTLSPMPESVTNNLIYSLWSSSLKSDKTAKENCDIWMKYNNQTDSYGAQGVPAVAWCRSQTIGGQSCDLPNAYETIVIWACGDQLDLMDPTAEANSALKLGYTSTGYDNGGRRQERDGIISWYLYSSTDYSYKSIRVTTCNGLCSYPSEGKRTQGSAIPILEL